MIRLIGGGLLYFKVIRIKKNTDHCHTMAVLHEPETNVIPTWDAHTLQTHIPIHIMDK
jgi:hypothetical protein